MTNDEHGEVPAAPVLLTSPWSVIEADGSRWLLEDDGWWLRLGTDEVWAPSCFDGVPWTVVHDNSPVG